MAVVAAVLLGVAVGVAIALLLGRRQRDVTAALVTQLRDESRAERDSTLRATIDTVVTVAGDKLGAHRELARGDLEAKKELIDAQLSEMSRELAKVTGLVRDLETDRVAKFGELSAQLRAAGEQTARLSDMTQQLRQALSSTKARGQWGERMADDVLRLAGFLENVNYRKQATIQAGRPDFTFLLPRDLLLHMDVKFPLDNYLSYLEADTELERERFRTAFLRDVRTHVRLLARRDYAADAGECVDCVLLFIPNEQLYAFIQEQDATVTEDALRDKVVFCSPLTLFAVLAVIRQSVDNFALERTSREILSLLAGFDKQWRKFVEQMDTLDKRLESTRRAFDELVGARRRQLERPLEQLETLRRERALPDDPDEVAAIAELPRAARL